MNVSIAAMMTLHFLEKSLLADEPPGSRTSTNLPTSFAGIAASGKTPLPLVLVRLTTASRVPSVSVGYGLVAHFSMIAVNAGTRFSGNMFRMYQRADDSAQPSSSVQPRPA